MAKCRVLIVDDHHVVIDGIKSTLAAYPEFETVGEATNGREAVKQVRSLNPDIVILDISMPDLNGIDAALQIRTFNPDIRIVVFTMYSDGEYVRDLFKAGISAYILKEDPMSDLVKAIQAVRKGETFMGTVMPGIALTRNRTAEELEYTRDGFGDLSLREREVLQLIAEGNSIKDIAVKLTLSPKTIESHKYHIMQKLGITTLADMTKIAIKKKLIKA
jgi:DNA-binding NarL/FixJ family response regulator